VAPAGEFAGQSPLSFLERRSFELVLALNIQLQQDQQTHAEIIIDQAGLFVLPNRTPEQIEAQLYGIGCDLLFG
jgi:preprotein translocase subunit SecB